MARIKIQDLKNFCINALEKEGMKPELAVITATVLTKTDAYGTHSHGTKNLHNYIKKARAGGLTLNAEPEIIKEGPSYALMDGNNAMGMVCGVMGMELACKKASETGVGLVTIRNSNHFGAAGYYANIASEKGMIGFVVSNVDPNMNAPGARSKALGNNPIAYAAPAISVPSVFLDIALSNVASLKVFKARAEGKSIPDTWIVDKDGLPTTDPSRYPEEGAMQPMAGHKGYGLAVFVDLITGVMNGGATSMSGEIDSWVLSLDKPNNVCHTFIAIDASKFIGEGVLAQRTEDMAQTLRSLPKAKGSQRIYTPGEIEWENYRKSEREGISIPDDVLESLKGLAEDMQIELPVFD
ncbi:MAG TPA: Ldh family oxidoreductase [Thermoclostridium caenicola]|uniref:Malate/lactate/ureidoglycolate dehydrogenase, LDH2 family n=1 Tax=Thermoclostridium caenicola TaxID=659425 RepID=A0A1M6G3S2_9FIRM|nr:Ldh family oxidoreductase [Thermoclostridium caenicola]SHJ04482.1 Malate/lactate/ureidoglycolate dehydrogenase, LDH2 family [Thermoclostridium caenicola]HOK43144.1 Ldh family oxidoreductase [Thermoclostridium caenicola]HOL83789.1 Ldh family oxidoreductase [Thermoclostridium caenicola]HPO75811.1 Ldh family oxidoreductase [Thermoclostridium caenicola]